MANEFGQTVRTRRKQRGYSFKDFAQWCGISQTYLSLIERGLIAPPIDDKIRQMADLLAMHRDDLMYLAGRLPPDVRRIAQDQPQAVAKLVRKHLK